MDTNIAAVIVVIIFALVIIAAFLIFRKTRVSVNSPLGEMKIDGSNDPADPKPAINIEDVESKKGGIVAEDNTGRGVNITGAKTADDILASSSDPKNKPPA